MYTKYRVLDLMLTDYVTVFLHGYGAYLPVRESDNTTPLTFTTD